LSGSNHQTNVELQGPPGEFAHFQSDFCQLLYLSHFLPKLTEW
jgi:hypothetical protein